MRHQDLYASCDVFDCSVNTALLPKARRGATTCIYNSWEEPSVCDGVASMLKLKEIGMTQAGQMLLCKSAAHQWKRYIGLLTAPRAAGQVTTVYGAEPAGPMYVPTCQIDFSELTESLIAVLPKRA